MRRSADEAGFTLLEIVVALVVLGILLLTLARGTEFGLSAFDRQNRMSETAGQLEAVDRTLRRLITEADPGNSNDGRTLTGTAHAMAFRAPLPSAGLPSAGLASTGLASTGVAATSNGPPLDAMPLDAKPANLRLSVEHGALELSSVPFRHVIPLGPPPAPLRTVLLQNVQQISLSYWADGRWRTGWDGIDLPELVRIRIVFPEGDPRHWPDIVVAPMLHQPG